MNFLDSFRTLFCGNNISTTEKIEKWNISIKYSLAMQVNRVIMLVILFAAMFVVGLDRKVQAEEQSIDATNTTPYSYSIEANKSEVVIPISFPKIGVYTYKFEVTNFSNEVHVSFYRDSACTDREIIYNFKGTEAKYMNAVPEASSYYMVVYSDNPPALEKTVKVTCTYEEPQTEGRTISEGEEVRSVSLDFLYYPFTLSRDSKIRVYGEVLILCDANKKNLLTLLQVGEDGYHSAYLKKGTYYFKVPKGIHTFKYTTEKVTFYNNTTKKKAKKINIGKKTQMKFYATNKESSLYYKFTLKKAKKISVMADLSKKYSAYSVNIKIFKKKDGKEPYMYGDLSDGKKGKISFSGVVKNDFTEKKTVKLPAGTYYMVVSGDSEGGDAAITVK